MHIEINPNSLLNLQSIFKVLYKLHPSVLNDLVEKKRLFGALLELIGFINPLIPIRNFLDSMYSEIEYSKEHGEPVNMLKLIEEYKDLLNQYYFEDLRKYIQLDTDEYIPMKIYVEVEDPVIGRKLKELVETFEKTNITEQFYLKKQKVDEYAYFAKGYNLKMNEEQEKQLQDFCDRKDFEGLEKLLREKNLYP